MVSLISIKATPLLADLVEQRISVAHHVVDVSSAMTTVEEDMDTVVAARMTVIAMAATILTTNVAVSMAAVTTVTTMDIVE